MIFFYIVILLFQFNSANSQANILNLLSQVKNRLLFGPSYRPAWWNPDLIPGLRLADFGYEGLNGPSRWSYLYSECGGTQQSPINIQTEDLKRRKTKTPLTWTGYSNIPDQVILENSGHSIHLKGNWTNSNDIPYISNGPLKKNYYFSQLHFHWGKDSSRGSEHTVNKQSFPMEMHVVHDRNQDIDSNSSESEDSDELVVVSFMFSIIQKDNPNLNPILEGTRKVQGSTSKSTNIKPFPLSNLIEEFKEDYVSYKGSLTTPPCTEGVIWIVNSKPLEISERQLEIIRRSITKRNGYAMRNYRPVQERNGRNIYYIYS